MNIKNIKTLVNIISNSNLTVLEVSEADCKIRLEKALSESANSDAIISCTEKVSKQVEVTGIGASQEGGNKAAEHYTEIKAPLVGVFYAAPSSDAQPFVTIGSKVKKGDVVCIIEVMKVMNEILAEQDGEIIDICAKNGELVEFGQTLFKIS